jgi:hypothetical protein
VNSTHVDLAVIQERFDRSLELLRSTYTQASDGWGWYHRLDEPTPGPSATAVALNAFYLLGFPRESVTDGLHLLKARQLRSPHPLRAGGWPINTSSGQPMLEATSVIVRFLGEARLGLLPNGPNLDAGVAWIENNQDPSGGWGSFLGEPPRVWLTCLALVALSKSNPYSPSVNRGVDWLIKHRSKVDDRAWGETATKPPSAVHTSFVLYALSELAGLTVDGSVDRVVERAYAWLDGHSESTAIFDEASRVENYNVTIAVDEESHVFHSVLWHHGLPYIALALLRHPAGRRKRAADAIITIMESQLADGHWPNIDGASGRSIWDVWPFLLALHEFSGGPPVPYESSVDWLDEDVAFVRYGQQYSRSLTASLWQARRSEGWAAARRNVVWITLTIWILGAAIALAAHQIKADEFAFGVAFPVFLSLVAKRLNRS